MSEADTGSEETRQRFFELGVEPEVHEELLAYTHNPYRDLLEKPLGLPMADEPHLDAWRDYVEEAGRDGAVTVLRKKLVQLWFPVREGMSEDPTYRAAVYRGATPWPVAGIELQDPDSVSVGLHDTAAGSVPVIVAGERQDFETLVRALTARNEPVPVPGSMGACLVQGLVNQDRVRRHRSDWSDGKVEDAAASWPEEFKRIVPQKDLYQDRVLLLSSGYYSAVSPEEVARDESAWLADSLLIRREHECFHYLTLRLAGSIRSHLLDEIIADLAGLLAAYGQYRADTALLLLGLDRHASVRPGARLLNYRGDPCLSEGATDALNRLVVRAISNLADALEARPTLAMPTNRDHTLLMVAGIGIPGLASSDLQERLGSLP